MSNLEGISIVVTRPREKSAELAESLSALGAEVLAVPAIEVRMCHDSDEMRRAAGDLRHFEWVVFTSANGASSFLRCLRECDIPIEHLSSRKLAAIGSETAAALKRGAREPDVVPKEFLAREIPDCMGDLKGKRVLLPRANIADLALPQELAGRGAEVLQVAAYEIVENSDSELLRAIKKINSAPDLITFTSPSTFRGFASIARRAGRENWLHESELVAIGPVTASAITEAGFEPALVAEPHTSQGIVCSIIKWAENRRQG